MLARRRPTGFRAHAPALRRLAEEHPVWIAGRVPLPACSRRWACATSAPTSSLRWPSSPRRRASAAARARRHRRLGHPAAEQAAERQDAVTASGHDAKNRTRAGEPSRRRTETSA